MYNYIDLYIHMYHCKRKRLPPSKRTTILLRYLSISSSGSRPLFLLSQYYPIEIESESHV